MRGTAKLRARSGTLTRLISPGCIGGSTAWVRLRETKPSRDRDRRPPALTSVQLRARWRIALPAHISPPETARRSVDFIVKKIFVRVSQLGILSVPRAKTRRAHEISHAKPRGKSMPALSTQKLTENFQDITLICLTVYSAIPISCGQGSGHPHPVVVDNVSGSFGN